MPPPTPRPASGAMTRASQGRRLNPTIAPTATAGPRVIASIKSAAMTIWSTLGESTELQSSPGGFTVTTRPQSEATTNEATAAAGTAASAPELSVGADMRQYRPLAEPMPSNAGRAVDVDPAAFVATKVAALVKTARFAVPVVGGPELDDAGEGQFAAIDNIDDLERRPLLTRVDGHPTRPRLGRPTPNQMVDVTQ